MDLLNIQVIDKKQQGTMCTKDQEVLLRDRNQNGHGLWRFLMVNRSFLADVSLLENLERGGGEREEYWFLAMKGAARVAKALVTESNTAGDTQPD